MGEYKLYAGGRFVEGAETCEIRSPYDNKALALVHMADAGMMNSAIDAAVGAAKEMAQLSLYERAAALSMIADELERQKDLFAWILVHEAGKPLKYADGEVARAVQTFRIAAGEALRQPGEYLRLDWSVPGTGKEGWLKYFPVGPIGAISPFNFPLNLAVHKLAPAIAAGNTMVLKPASQTPVTMLELARIIDKTNLPKGSVNIVPAGREVGSMLVTDQRLRLLTFTGSPEVGWNMKKIAGQKKVVLELGGNAGVVVDETADLDLAVKKCVAGGFAYSGQVCIHTQRIYVSTTVFEAFVDRFVRLAGELKEGDPMSPETDISVMIDVANARRVEEWVQEAVAGGATILCGGKAQGRYFPPTVLTNTLAGMKVCSLEVFGPVVAIEPVPDFETGLQRVNDSAYGLQAGIFTNNLKRVNQAFNTLEVGGVIVNDVPTFRVDHMPYGGVKNSGTGREGVRYAMMAMMEPRLLVKDI